MNQPQIERSANYFAPDDFRYGVMFSDGSVATYWNGSTQHERAEEYARGVVADQIATNGRHDNITLARRVIGGEWERVTRPAVEGGA